MEHRLLIGSPIGPLALHASDTAVTAIRFCGGSMPDKAQHESGTPTPLLLQAARELEEYFAGRRREFSFRMAAEGTPFQQKVWKALQTIPYGETRTYKQIAEQIGHPKAYRAVGMANNLNPLPIVVPCHRVVGSDGKLVGYAGGVQTKIKLLEIEK